MNKVAKIVLLVLMGVLGSSQVFAQGRVMKESRRPPERSDAAAQDTPQKAPDGAFSSILNGLPVLLELHHDTEVGTNKPVDVYMFVIEMQIVNSDGDLEPEGLQIHNYYTAQAQQPMRAINPHNARDCKIWNGIILNALSNRDPEAKVWPYVEFTTEQGARILQTNEDGQVFWSDDIECWGVMDRFPPF